MKENQTTNFLNDIIIFLNNINTLNDDIYDKYKLNLLDTFACLIEGKKNIKSKNVYNAYNLKEIKKSKLNIMSASGFAVYFGTAIHSLDFDDYETAGTTHPSGPLISSISAMSLARKIKFKNFIDAYILGYQALTLLGLKLAYDHYASGWHSTSTIGSLSSAISCSYLLEGNECNFDNSLSIASSMSAGMKKQFGTDVKALHCGLAAKAGIEAAALANNGIKGNHEFLDGEYGMLSMYNANKDINKNSIDPRTPAILINPTFRKPWPSCSYTHRSIMAAKYIYENHHYKLNDIKKIEITIPEPYFRVSNFLKPTKEQEARFSLPYCVSKTLIEGNIYSNSFDLNGFKGSKAEKLVKLTKVIPYTTSKNLNDMCPKNPDMVKVTLQNNQTLEKQIKNVLGGSVLPMHKEEVIEKFLSCGGSKKQLNYLLNISFEDNFSISKLLSI